MSRVAFRRGLSLGMAGDAIDGPALREASAQRRGMLIAGDFTRASEAGLWLGTGVDELGVGGDRSSTEPQVCRRHHGPFRPGESWRQWGNVHTLHVFHRVSSILPLHVIEYFALSNPSELSSVWCVSEMGTVIV
jgi:hypothetical protein